MRNVDLVMHEVDLVTKSVSSETGAVVVAERPVGVVARREASAPERPALR
jgi:hypothetical protein